MSGVPYDLDCPECGADHPHQTELEGELLSGMGADEVQWVCPDCGSVATIERDVEEL